MYASNSGYAMTQYPGGIRVTVPMQAGSSMVPIQNATPGSLGGQPQMVVVPVSGTVGNQPQFAHSQIATSGVMTTGFQHQFAQVATPGAIATAYQAQVPPKYEEGGYTKTGNDEV